MKKFHENYLNKIKGNVDSNINLYKQEKPFIKDYESMVGEKLREFLKTIKLQTQLANNEKLDFTNSKTIYKGLSHLSLAEVSN